MCQTPQLHSCNSPGLDAPALPPPALQPPPFTPPTFAPFTPSVSTPSASTSSASASTHLTRLASTPPAPTPPAPTPPALTRPLSYIPAFTILATSLRPLPRQNSVADPYSFFFGVFPAISPFAFIPPLYDSLYVSDNFILSVFRPKGLRGDLSEG